ncbi:glutathione S-transferase [Escherichia coli]|uniref:Glutathione S-transferase n=1 Tax=Escherichia coli TaxID=562 RepID=A0A2X3K7M4_ECOLX|nr:glutathione S-transferase [Escherichia coli]
MIKVYGVPGWGSTISELMLTLADIPYQFVDVSGFDHEGTSRELLKTLNRCVRFRHWRWKMTRL